MVTIQTRKLWYCKDDRAVRLIYMFGCGLWTLT